MVAAEAAPGKATTIVTKAIVALEGAGLVAEGLLVEVDLAVVLAALKTAFNRSKTGWSVPVDRLK